MEQRKEKPGAGRVLFVVLGCVCVGLGAVGVVLPVLPAQWMEHAAEIRLYFSCGLV